MVTISAQLSGVIARQRKATRAPLWFVLTRRGKRMTSFWTAARSTWRGHWHRRNRLPGPADLDLVPEKEPQVILSTKLDLFQLWRGKSRARSTSKRVVRQRTGLSS